MGYPIFIFASAKMMMSDTVGFIKGENSYIMEYQSNAVGDLRIAYIGGGSRGWAWTLMNDLTKEKELSGEVTLYDIDFAAAKKNEVIGNRIEGSQWSYRAVATIGEALTGADFVIISILPATFDEMESDVHAPEAYGIYQSVGDTTGPGGFFRAMRTVPMIREIARAIREYCPKAWVINYTNPMAVCVQTLYREFPGIKAFGCCHEVFGTQKLLGNALKEMRGVEHACRGDICVNVVGVNHFTWFTEAHYRNVDLFKVYREFVDKYYESGYENGNAGHWMNDSFQSAARVRFDLFRRFGYIAAAGDRHLAEFMDAGDYLASPEQVREWKFGLTPVSWRKADLVKRLEKSQRLYEGTEVFKMRETGEEGVAQMKALLGLGTKVTNVNLPNGGQIPDLPIGTVVETNAALRADMIQPVFAGAVPKSIFPYVERIAKENNATVEACFSEDRETAYRAFSNGHLLSGLTEAEKRELFKTMFEHTKEYLSMYH